VLCQLGRAYYEMVDYPAAANVFEFARQADRHRLEVRFASSTLPLGCVNCCAGLAYMSRKVLQICHQCDHSWKDGMVCPCIRGCVCDASATLCCIVMCSCLANGRRARCVQRNECSIMHFHAGFSVLIYAVVLHFMAIILHHSPTLSESPAAYCNWSDFV